MDPLIHINKVSPYKPSFPLFNISLLAEASIDFQMSDLIPVEQISKTIHEKLYQEIDLDGGFDLFSQANNIKFLSNSEKQDKSENLDKKLGKKKNRSPISMSNKSNLKSQKLTRAGVIKRNTHAKLDHKDHLEPVSSLNKRPFSALGNANEEPHTFPSLASILGEDEQFTDEEDEPPIEKKISIKRTEPVEKQNNSFLEIDLSRAKKGCEEMPVLMNGVFNEAFNILDQGVSIFAKLLCDSSPTHRKGEKNRKIKYNPLIFEEDFNTFNLYHNLAVNEKQGNFEKASEKRIVDSFERKLDESAKFRFHDNTSFSASATVHL